MIEKVPCGNCRTMVPADEAYKWVNDELICSLECFITYCIYLKALA